jgi:hypothetical protein
MISWNQIHVGQTHFYHDAIPYSPVTYYRITEE